MLANIAVLVSGGGTNLQSLIDAQKSGVIKSGEIKVVVSNVEGAYALERAKNHGIKPYSISEKQFGGKGFEEKLQEILDNESIDLIILAGFLHVLSKDFVRKYPKRIINIHPSLIPSFCGDGYYGLKVHQSALDYGVKLTGATVHFVNEVTDGGEIISQKSVDIEDGDTAQSLQRKVMENAEWVLLPLAVEKVSNELINIKE